MTPKNKSKLTPTSQSERQKISNPFPFWHTPFLKSLRNL
ncbi:hypothetical protein HDEF_0422 [Candidatus Hamiltonella defensa 5AT (Acyrthosiphon pisum)]|uniref:Uncharacterized protein n=1 Tax=Hamiltonella defensa subsp. Acyrthosiphon pisum (strain 5AT) TaxID=572265 RepID=C4K3N3_HAMD5|nr:hypothetical protein HDEF_0422 [Candidatus Hamiltonella defensa 5AT (Acyrthosiphon pisum)]